MSVRDAFYRSSFANLIAGTLVLIAMVYAVYVKDGQAVSILGAAAVGWLFKEVKR